MTRGSLLGILILLVAASALAVPGVAQARVDLGLGTNLTYFMYQESLAPPQKSTETAAFPTFLLDARIFFLGESYMRMRGETARNMGSVYDGSDLHTLAAVQSVNVFDLDDMMIELGFSFADRYTVFAGYGYRAWNRHLSGTPGYRELYSWFYMPIGARARIYRDAQFDVSLEAAVRPTTKSKIQVITSETYTNGQDSEMSLGNKIGYRLATPASWRFHPSWSLSVSPWYEHSELGESAWVSNPTFDPSGSGIIREPASKTDQFGCEAMLVFSF